MVGGVYKIPIQGLHNNYPHPHVVVLEISGTKECLIVPGFSDGGIELEMYLDAAKKRGYQPDEVCVTLDNSQHIKFTGSMTGKIARWIIERHRRITMKELNSAVYLGHMDEAGLAKIAQGMVALADSKPEGFSQALVKRLRKMAASD